MTTAFATACRAPGCPEVTRERFCPAHKRAHEAQPARRAAKHIYASEEWRRLRAAVLARDPLCECGAPAIEVDHIVPRSQGGADTTDNLVGRCHRCHSRKTAGEMAREEDGRWG